MFLSKLLSAADHPYLFGKGGRAVSTAYPLIASVFSVFQLNNNPSLMQGMTVKSIKHHTALQPLFIIMGAGIVFVCAYIGR
jgi:hypothetical protein